MAAFGHLAEDVNPMLAAKAHGKSADSALERFRGIDSTAPGAGNQRFQALGDTVIKRNRELKSLTHFATTSDVSTEKDKGVLWSGDHFEGGKVKASAMHTAQAYAAGTGKKTVEMTEGGRDLDKYIAPEGNSFNALRKRFKYLHNPQDGGAPVMAEMMEGVLAKHGTDGMETHQVRQDQSSAGALWDVLSKRYAGGLTGDVTGVHAYPEDQHEALTKGPLANNTYNTVEKPTVKAKGQAQVHDVFGDDKEIAPYLRSPKK
jgi:hypothetical protein